MTAYLRKKVSSFHLSDRSAKREKRDLYVDGLHKVWKRVSVVESPYVTTSSCDMSDIRIWCVDVFHESSSDEAAITPIFFRKMPHEKLQGYEIDSNDKQTMIDVSVQKDLWVSNEQDLCDELHPLGLAGAICNALQLAFDTNKRKISDGQKTTLMQKTGWKRVDFANGIFHSAFLDDVFHSQHWYPLNAWQSGKPKDQPHVMFTMAHEYEGKNSCLLRGEVLAIIAIMLTRLASDSLTEHNIIPVMALSIMAGRKGRVLQAYFADEGLVVFKSRLFSFAGEDDGKIAAEFFLQYMGSEIIGATEVSRLSFRKIAGDEATAVTEVHHSVNLSSDDDD
ncbi:hypothetical protein CNMCM7691_002060 [Aspergillus felis]|uniref:Uncharacterized protein n=1 Tax=Aspergillus felis TaxID=1287682 RepID=A0A8H6QZK5_9EURO|nr:hypothetical protein CNMCM7691_002060 [Aspergillus felis]